MDFAALSSFALALLISGVFAGLVAGMLGVGGGIVVVPVLYYVFSLMGVDENLRMHIATATSLAVMIPTSLSSVRSHNRKGVVDHAQLKRWIGPMVAGVIAGSVLSGYTSGKNLSLIFALVSLPMALNMAFGKEEWRIANHLPRGIGGAALPFGIGGISTLMGVGGGMTGVPAMTLCGIPIHRAVGTASAFGAIISIPGTIGAILAGWNVTGLPPFSLGYVNLAAMICLAPASYFTAPLGAHIAHKTDKKRLRALFAIFIVITASRMLYDALR
jgi:uncharacterized membrane protein YfcA